MTLQRQQFQLGVTAQETSAYDNVKGVGVQHFAVLGYLSIAHTNGHGYPPPAMERMVLPSTIIMVRASVFPISACFSNQRATMDSVVPV